MHILPQVRIEKKQEQHMKKVLIPTDLTLYSLQLIRYALNLIQGESCHITLLYLTPSSDSITDLLTLPRPKRPDEEFHQALERLRRLHSVEIQDIKVAHMYCTDSSDLKQFVREKQIDLVLSTVPQTRTTEALSFFNELLQDVPFPVLHIPEFFAPNSFRKIAFVLDADSKTSALPDQELIDLLWRKESRITFLLVFKPGTSPEKLTQALSKLYDSPVLANVTYSVHLVHQRDVTEGIVSFIDEFEVDLVVSCKKKSMLDFLRPSRQLRSREQAITAKVPCLSVA